MNRIEQCFELEQEEELSLYKKVHVGRGAKVHYLTLNGKRAMCGAGDIGVGPRRRSSLFVVKSDLAVTCAKCQEKMSQHS